MRLIPARTRAAEFRAALTERILVADGAMATSLFVKGALPNRPTDELNLKLPALVRDVHQDYLRAGSEIIATNTFGANRIRLAPFALGTRVAAINQAGVRIAREAARETAFVAGTVGPLGVRLEPLGSTNREDARLAFVEQITALVDAGVDLLILETFTNLAELELAVSAAREVAPQDLVVVAQVSVEDDGSLHDGTPTAAIAHFLDALPVDVIGLNCCSGPRALLETLEKIAALTHKPLSAMPNAGLPTFVDGSAVYHCSPEYLAQYARRYLEAGARIVGGCCGTTPDHIREIHREVVGIESGPRVNFLEVEEAPEKEARALPPVASAQKSGLGAALAERRFVRLLEILPPRGVDATAEIEAARAAKAAGIYFMSVPDGPRAVARMSAPVLARMLQDVAGTETLLHFCCRDRNVLGIQSDLLGAQASGLRNVLCVTGDPPRAGAYPSGAVAGVFEVDSIGLTRIARDLNHGIDLGGNPLGSQTALLLGVAANPASTHLDEELRRLERKAEAGAEFIVTQPVFDLALLDAFLKRIESFHLPVIAGVWPLSSIRNAEFLVHELRVPIPEESLSRMRTAENAEAARGEGVALAREMIGHLTKMVAGVQLSAPFGRYKMALDAVEGIGPG
jgi:methionine synthase I (cobalamin-dependent)/5,10-methylenetetrahydrofolate reductase